MLHEKTSFQWRNTQCWYEQRIEEAFRRAEGCPARDEWCIHHLPLQLQHVDARPPDLEDMYYETGFPESNGQGGSYQICVLPVTAFDCSKSHR